MYKSRIMGEVETSTYYTYTHDEYLLLFDSLNWFVHSEVTRFLFLSLGSFTPKKDVYHLSLKRLLGKPTFSERPKVSLDVQSLNPKVPPSPTTCHQGFVLRGFTVDQKA